MPPILAGFWSNMQRTLFPRLEETIREPLTDELKRVVVAFDVVRIEEFIQAPGTRYWLGRPRSARAHVARAFVAKSVLGLPTTRALRERLLSDPALRELCGYQFRCQIPSESTFSRSYAEFAESGLCQRVHEALAAQHLEGKLILHVSRDSTEVLARERAVVRRRKERPAIKQKCGRKKQGEPPRQLTRLEKQVDQTPEEALAELPRLCDYGKKKDTDGNEHWWRGFKLHIDWTDSGLPIQSVLTSASVHDSQVAIPMAKRLAGLQVCYQVMDSAYDADLIHEAVAGLGHRPIIAVNGRRTSAQPWDKATIERYKIRTVAERGNSRLKESFGFQNVRVRGAPKVLTHLMFGVLALFAEVTGSVAAQIDQQLRRINNEPARKAV